MSSSNFGATRAGQVITSNGATQLAAPGSAARDALIDNRDDADVAILFGGSTVEVAFATGVRIPAGQAAVFGTGGHTHIAVAAASGSPNVVVHLGEGL
jgi:hypothetical protein